MPKETSPAIVTKDKMKPVINKKIEKSSKSLLSNTAEKKEIINYISKEEFKAKNEIAILEPIKCIELDKIKTPVFQLSPILAQIQSKKQDSTIFKVSLKPDKYLSLKEYARQEINKLIKEQKVVEDGKFDLWALAKTGVKQINHIINSNVELEKTQDTVTNRTRIEINTGLLGFYSSKNK